MFGMGMNEILIVLAIAVIIIGPKQLPQVARAMGKMVAQFKRATNDLRSAVNDEVGQHTQFGELHDMKSTLEDEIRNIGQDATTQVESEFGDVREIGGGVARDLATAVNDMPARDFELDDSGDSEKPGEKGAQEKDGREETASAKSADGEPSKSSDSKEKPSGSNGGEKTRDGGYV